MSLYRFCKNENLPMVELLLKFGADPNEENYKQKRPLYAARFNVGLTQLLVDYGANVNLPVYKDMVPLHFACYFNNIDMARVLLENGAFPMMIDEEGNTPLFMSCFNYEMTKLLLEYGAIVHIHEFAYACQHAPLEVVELLSMYVIDINEMDSGLTPLDVALLSNRIDVVRVLIKNGADINKIDELDWTPLDTACFYSNVDIIEFLIKNGAKITTEAFQCDRNEVISLLNRVSSTVLE